MKKRRHPAHGVEINPIYPTIVFLTVCTRERQAWLATDENHQGLRDIWSRSRAWLVGRYVLMPDHLHLFAAPGLPELPFDNWVRYWKSLFTKTFKNSHQVWHANHWDTRLRSEDS